MKKIVLLLGLVSLVTSCTPDDLDIVDSMNIVESKGWFSKNIPGKTVVVAGSTLEDGAVIWINEKKIILIGNALEATGLYQLNSKIYVTGWEYGGQGSVWVMDLDGSNQKQSILEGKFSEGQRITLHKGDIYVGGWFDNGSCYWKNGSKRNLTVNADSMSWDIAFDENDNQFNVAWSPKCPINAQCGLQLVRFGLQDVPSSANSSSRWPPKKGHHMDTFKSAG